jgi:hypothetical protein
LAGKRDPGCATEFLQDLANRLANRVQMTTDGLKCYLTAVPEGFGSDIDYAMLVKVYGNDTVEGEKRYSPAICSGCKKQNKIGDPDPEFISTSVHRSRAWLVPSGFAGLQRATGRERMEPLARAVRKSSGLNIESSELTDAPMHTRLRSRSWAALLPAGASWMRSGRGDVGCA